MAKLFSREYHDLSNTWYFKSKLLPFNEGELRYQAVYDEVGYLLIRFFAIPEKQKYFPEDLIIKYNRSEEKILEYRCKACSDSTSCNHLLTVINYGYHYLSTPEYKESSDSEEKETETALKIDFDQVSYASNLLSYNAYWQQMVLNGKILIAGLYDDETDKIRFHFADYQGIDLKELAVFNQNRVQPQFAAKRKKDSSTHRQSTGNSDLKLIQEQAAAFSDSELALISLLQSIKCSYSGKYSYYTIYKRDLVRTFPFVRDLQSKILIKETGEQLTFSEEEYSLSLQVEKTDDDFYRIRMAKGIL